MNTKKFLVIFALFSTIVAAHRALATPVPTSSALKKCFSNCSSALSSCVNASNQTALNSCLQYKLNCDAQCVKNDKVKRHVIWRL